ncbi:hypothetical protein [Pseudarthrobacter sp. J47]|uniref:hypothetical protein n=1 Tax=Pseudarthrobacter sp. J47 TaxID=3116482 RepID=UPI002E801486|nr:hypothetical protein [Pseudarthrobacter sp. J47]MEE2524534.1 hypothetical protein [Pseudarthrobacter sp. J47]
MLRYIGRWPFCTVEQIGPFMGMSDQVVRRRIRALRGHELLTADRLLVGFPALVSLTREGMRLIGISGPVVGPKLGQFHHDYLVVQWATEQMAKQPAWTFVTEREMRAADTVNQQETTHKEPLYAVERLAGKTTERIYPDFLAINQDGDHLAFELEYSRKHVARLNKLMTAYSFAERIKGVQYFCLPDPYPGVTRAANEVNAKMKASGRPQKIWVKEWSPNTTRNIQGEMINE